MPTNAGYVSDSDRNNSQSDNRNGSRQPTNGQNESSTLQVNLETYFSDERIRIPDKVSVN